MTRAYVFIETAVGQARMVLRQIQAVSQSDLRVLSADTVTGPFDVIVRIEARDEKSTADAVNSTIGNMAGVSRTLTCLAIQQNPRRTS
jgi:DNA-binding Lrp family transcriptional regulator